MNSTRKFAAGLAFAAIALPLATFAQTTTSTGVNTQIQSLLTQIKALQQQIMQLVASSSASGGLHMGSTTGMMNPGQMGKAACIALNRNLGIGSHGDDVVGLQRRLKDEGDFDGPLSGFFGALTAKAMMKFQMRLGIASSTTGSVGPMTRGFFERECGKGLGKGDDGNKGNQGDDHGMPNAARISGTITAAASSSVTITPNGGQPRVVNITASTSIQIFVSATSTPTTGKPNQDGSLTAAIIKVGILPPPPMMGDDHGQGRGHDN